MTCYTNSKLTSTKHYSHLHNYCDLPVFPARFRYHMDKMPRSFGCDTTSQHPCVYILKHEGVTTYIPNFVEDIGLLDKDKKIFNYIKAKLSNHFTITIYDDMNYYLGMG